jgi:hypothetical protein
MADRGGKEKNNNKECVCVSEKKRQMAKDIL